MTLEKRFNMETDTSLDLSIGRLLLLTFVPAILMLAIIVVLTVFFSDVIPPTLSQMIAILLVLVPFELGVILYTSKKEYGRCSLKSAFIYNNKLSIGKLLLKTLLPLIIAIVAVMIIKPFENQFMFDTIFKFVPESFKHDDFVNQVNSYPKVTIIISCIAMILLNGFAAPIVEELYFRGFIMPRLSRFKGFAPVITTVLFSLYHLFSPWENITRIVAMMPYHFVVWKEKNIYIGIVLHCFLNVLSSIFFTVTMFQLMA